jgi:hypothetical protein
MTLVTKYAAELTKSECERLYAIHKKIYHSKNIGLPFDAWKSNLDATYHGITSKRVHLWINEGTRNIAGYVIATVPVAVDRELWSKMIEGGADAENPKESVTAFLSMIRGILNCHDNPAVNFLAETGLSYPRVADLLRQCSFSFLEDLEQGQQLISGLLNSHRFFLSCASQGLVIRRQTIYTRNYEGFVQIFDRRKRITARPAFSIKLGFVSD